MDFLVDIETNGIEATVIHCVSIHNGDRIQTLTEAHKMASFITNLSKDDRLIGHNFIRYDAPTLERLLKVKIPCQIVDTLALSWYLTPEMSRHGLAQWGERLGIAKPTVDDWENADLAVYVERCEEDVKINYDLWTRQKAMLESIYSGDYSNLIRYLAHKMNCARLQEESRWKLDVDAANTLLQQLETEYQVAYESLGQVMPQVPKIAKRKRPAKPFKQDGSLSASGLKWQALCEERGLDLTHDEVIEVQVGTSEPNPSSTPQLKDWLHHLGWKPKTFKYKDNRRIEQIKTADGDLCSSIEKLVEQVPSLQHLASMTVVKHRIGLVQGLLKAQRDGYVKAEIQGLTNTLRFKHSVCVNIPSARKPYGMEIRALLTSETGNVLCGSDMSSLEDRTKQHYMWQFDPEYVTAMTTEGFDPHLDLALSAGAVTQEQVDAYKDGSDKSISTIRHNYKGGNYACTYGAGVATLSRQLGISEAEATNIHKAYWKRNWSLKSISKSVKVKGDWLFNPVSKMWYKLRSEKDIFSTLNQGTGVYCFDLWIGFILQSRKQLTAQFHDEIILNVEEGEEEKVEQLLNESMARVNSLLKLNRELDCDIQFGKNYCKIH